MTRFFNGQLLVTPTVASQVDDSQMADNSVSAGNTLILIGRSENGEPNIPLSFQSPTNARRVLKGGPLLKAIELAFSPGAQLSGPGEIIGVRVNPALQSSGVLKDVDGTDSIDLASTDYGENTAQISVKVEAGTDSGKRITSQWGNNYYVGDNLELGSFSIQYEGVEVTGEMDITASQIKLYAPAATLLHTIELSVDKTIQQVVDRVNSFADFTATLVVGSGEKPALNALDPTADEDIKTAAYGVTANIQAIIDWINSISEGFITASRSATAVKVPDNIASQYLSGGSDGTTTNDEWSNAFAMLQTVSARWIVPLSADAAIHAMAAAHVTFMSGPGKSERRSFVGGAYGSTIAQAQAAAFVTNNDRVALCFPGIFEYNDAEQLVEHDAYYLAAMVGGAFAGLPPGEALTNKSLNIKGLTAEVRNPVDTDDLINAGILSVYRSNEGYKVARSVSTWLVDDKYNRVEVSAGLATDYVAETVRKTVMNVIGKKASPVTVALLESDIDTVLSELAKPEPAGLGIIVGDDRNPAYRNIQIEIDGDAILVEFECSPVIPANYGLVTIHAVPYSTRL